MQNTLRELVPDSTVELVEVKPEFASPLEEAKYLITEFWESEYGSGQDDDFEDLHNIGLAYTTLTDDELPIQVTADLVDFKITYEYDGEIYDVEQYDSLEVMIQYAFLPLNLTSLYQYHLMYWIDTL